ncbi:hypothetical protein Hdeb2414_s0017g00502081 [Helianthus debilis subsp. tardiflorus]
MVVETIILSHHSPTFPPQFVVLRGRGVTRSAKLLVAESVLNSEELDKAVAHLVVPARNDGYAQGYAECSQHVNSALKVNWDTSKSATYGVYTGVFFAVLKTEFDN